MHRPVLEALELIKRYKAEHSPATLYYARGEHVPVDGVIPRDLADLLYKGCSQGKPKRRNASSFDLRREAWRSIPAE